MLRNTMIALLAAASLAILVPEAAMARPGGGSGGRGGMGGAMGARGGSFNAAAVGGAPGMRSAAIAPNNIGGRPGGWNHGHGANWNGRGYGRGGYGGFGAGLALGGLYGAYAWGDPYWYGYDDYYGDDNCYIVRQRVHTPIWLAHPAGSGLRLIRMFA